MSATVVGKEPLEIYPRLLVEGLHCLTSNDSDDFEVTFQHDGRVYRRRPIHWCKGSAINAGIATMARTVKAGREIAIIPSCLNGFRDKSTWAGLKLSPTSDEHVEAIERRGRRTLSCLRAYAYGRSILAEICGDGSWQFWAIRNGFSAHKTWWKLIENVSRDAGVIGEVFPSEDGRGMPAPGSWDAKTGRMSRVVYCDLTGIFREAAPYSAFATAVAPMSDSAVLGSSVHS